MPQTNPKQEPTLSCLNCGYMHKCSDQDSKESLHTGSSSEIPSKSKHERTSKKNLLVVDNQEAETIVQILSQVQFNAAKWAYMKLKGGLSEEDAAAKLFADRQTKAAKIEAHTTKQVEEVLDRVLESIDNGKKSHSMAVIRGAIEKERERL